MKIVALSGHDLLGCRYLSCLSHACHDPIYLSEPSANVHMQVDLVNYALEGPVKGTDKCKASGWLDGVWMKGSRKTKRVEEAIPSSGLLKNFPLMQASPASLQESGIPLAKCDQNDVAQVHLDENWAAGSAVYPPPAPRPKLRCICVEHLS